LSPALRGLGRDENWSDEPRFRGRDEDEGKEPGIRASRRKQKKDA